MKKFAMLISAGAFPAVFLAAALSSSAPAFAADEADPTATAPMHTEADTETEAPPIAPTKATKPKGPKVLDFEADVIEGERKAPNLFLQLETDNPDLDTLMYRRNTFNDYHERERSRRPEYRKPAQ